MAYFFRIISGTFLILLGIAAIAIPILPSSIFLVPGIMVMSGDVPLVARLICRLEQRFPRVGKFLGPVRMFLERHAIPPLSCRPEE